MKKSLDRRRVVIEAVIESLATHGLHHTTFESIGKLAKMQRSHITYYFANHDEMVLAAIQYVVLSAQQVSIEKIEEEQDVLAQVRAQIRAVFEHVKLHPSHNAIWTLLWHLSSHNPAYLFLHSQMRQTGIERLVGILRGDERFSKMPHRELFETARSLQAIVFGHQQLLLTSQCYKSVDDAREQAEIAAMHFLAANKTMQ